MADDLLQTLITRVMGSRHTPATPDPIYTRDGGFNDFDKLNPRTGNRPRVIENILDNPFPVFKKSPLFQPTWNSKVRNSGPVSDSVSQLLEQYPDALTRVPQITVQPDLGGGAAGDIAGPNRTPRISPQEIALWFGNGLKDGPTEGISDVLLHEIAHKFGYDEDDAQKIHSASHSSHPRMVK